MKLELLKNKVVVILGLGISGIDVIELFQKNNIDFYALDDGDCSDISNKYNIKIHTSDEFFAMNIMPDVIVKSPGIKYSHKIVSMNKKASIINDIELAYDICVSRGIKIVGVTGTNGKTSTTTFITRLLKHNGFKAYSCGNIGTSILSVLRDKEIIDYLVVELSSFQLKSIVDFKCDYAFFLNISEDHLDYHEDFKEYFDCKLNIVKNSTTSGYFFIKDDIAFNTKKLTLLKNDFDLDIISGLNLGGVNPENVKLVYQFCKIVGIDPDSIVELFGSNYKPLEHRLEFVANINGVNYINDSKATNVEATKSALSQLENVILLVGGSDKGEDLTKLKDHLSNVIQVIAYGDNKEKFDFIDKLIKCETLADALSIAKSIASRDNVILLSPASASFDQFKNFEHRGSEFKKLVNKEIL